jgi:hypothetical protein
MEHLANAALVAGVGVLWAYLLFIQWLKFIPAG